MNINRLPDGLVYIIFLIVFTLVSAFCGRYAEALAAYVPTHVLYLVCILLTGAGLWLGRLGKKSFFCAGLACVAIAGLMFLGIHFNEMQTPALRDLP